MDKTKEQSETKALKEKQLRAQRRQEKKEGKTNERLLAFLDEIIRACGYTHQTFAKKAGMTPQGVHWIFSVADDCTLSKAEEMLAALGLRLRVSLQSTKPGQKIPKMTKKFWQNGDVQMEISGNIGGIAEQENTYPYPKYIKDYPEDGRLKWMIDFIQQNHLNITQFARLIGYEPLTVRFWFTKDNLKISQIRDIARASGMKIVWKVEKAQ